MKRHIKEDASAPALNVSPVGGTKLSSSGQRLQDRLAKIPGLDKLMQNVSRRDDAAEILAAIAEKLGGDKMEASKALTRALQIAKKEETLNEHVSARVEAFVRCLFE